MHGRNLSEFAYSEPLKPRAQETLDVAKAYRDFVKAYPAYLKDCDRRIEEIEREKKRHTRTKLEAERWLEAFEATKDKVATLERLEELDRLGSMRPPNGMTQKELDLWKIKNLAALIEMSQELVDYHMERNQEFKEQDEKKNKEARSERPDSPLRE